MKQTVEEAAMQELMSSYATVVKGEFAYQQQVKYAYGSIEEMAMREVNKWIYPYIKTGYVTHWRPIQSFDEILEANKDVLERIKEKGD